MMQRIAPLRLPRLDPLDLMVLVALAVVPASYYLGFDLDWSALSPREEAAAAAPAAQESEARTALAAVPANREDQRGWNELVQRLEIEAITYPGRVAIYLKDLKRNRTWAYRGDDLFPSASLIKVPIMAAVFDKIHNGELSLQTKLVMHRRDRVGGSGSIKWYPDGT